MVRRKKTRVAIVDDQPFVGKGMSLMIDSYDDMKMIFAVRTSRELFQKLKSSVNFPDVLLLDIKLKDEDGMEVLVKVKEKYPLCRVVMMSYHEEPYIIIQSINKGANGYIKKSSESDSIIFNIRKVAQQGNYCEPGISQLLMRHAQNNNGNELAKASNPQALTRQETNVLELLCRFNDKYEIAEALGGISPRTVEAHKQKIMKKLGTTNPMRLVLYAIQNGIYIPSDSDFKKTKSNL
jgi:two-component system response regulator DegU